jgi:hypothetical protein
MVYFDINFDVIDTDSAQTAKSLFIFYTLCFMIMR